MSAQTAAEFNKSKVESPDGKGGMHATLTARRHVYIHIFELSLPNVCWNYKNGAIRIDIQC